MKHMAIKKLHSQALRFNGFTDGLVVPTGAYRESGVDLYDASHSEKTGGTNKVSSYNSDEPKIGLRHIPNEGNGLNNIVGPFTVEAFFIPDKGGVIVSKDRSYILEVGHPLKGGVASFTVYTRSSSGLKDAVVASTSYTFPALNTSYSQYASGEIAGDGFYVESDFTITNKPHDLDLPFQPLMYVNAQFTGKDVRIYINGDLVAKSDFGGEERTIQSVSSDMFIGGRGGEFRGIIESVRISRGTVTPKIQPFTKQTNTMGLWDFEDEDDIPELYFANYNAPAQSMFAGRDGVGQSNDKMPHPMVCVGYDFTNVTVGGNITNPLTLAAGYNYGHFKIRDFGGSKPTALLMLASHILSVPIDELPFQAWWNNGSGVLDIGAHVTKARYHADGLPVSNLNAVINASGTDPNTGVPISPYDYELLLQDPAGGISLDPFSNPIERIRIVALDFANNRIVIQNTMLQGTDGVADAKSQGFMFPHSDNTPVWFTLGNGDLMIDPGCDVRPAGQMTRARFTQGQRFKDKSGFGNDGYFVNTFSRNTNEMKDRLQISGGLSQMTDYPPLSDSLMLWLDADDASTLLGKDLRPFSGLSHHNEYPVWWQSKAPSAPKYHFYGGSMVGNAWRWIKNNPATNSRGALQAASLGEQNDATEPHEEFVDMYGDMFPLTPASVTKSMWANGLGDFGSGGGRVPGFRDESDGSVVPIPFAVDHTTAIGTTNAVATNNGDFSFYFVITPQYDGALHLIQNIANQIGFQLDNGAGKSTVNYSNFTDGMTTQPAAGVPCLVAININGTENGFFEIYTKAGGGTPIYAKTLSGTPAANAAFTDHGAEASGLELFGYLTTGGGSNTATPMAPPGFIVHEVLIYAGYHKTNYSHLDVRQYVEDKWGI